MATDLGIFSLVIDSLSSAFSNIWVVTGLAALFIFIFFTTTINANLIESLFFSATPFLITAFHTIIPFGYIMGMVIILGALILVVALSKLFSR